MARSRWTWIAAAAALLGAPLEAGDVDPTFGTGGVVQVDVGSTSVSATGVVRQPDGKLVIGGSADGAAVLVRVDADGALDPTFGAGGIAAGPSGGANDLVLQPDGKLVTAGGNFRLVRFEADGTLDATFGAGGVADAPLDGGFCDALELQDDGKLVTLGWCCAGIFSNAEARAQRLLPDGTLDPAFGSSGVASPPGIRGRDLAIQPDGQIVTAANISGATSGSWSVGRLTTTGGTSFSFSYSWGPKFDEAWAVGLQSDGRIVVAGDTEDAGGSGVGQPILRLTTAGSLDTTFGTGGTVHNLAAGAARDLVVLDDDRFVVAGGGGFALTRYLADGTVDATFGAGGTVAAPVSGAAVEVLAQPDGKLVAVGTSDGRFTLVRFDPGAATPLALPYGCGVNPAGSLTVLSGSAAIGGSVELGVDDPTGAQAPGSLPLLALAIAPDPAHPCGTVLPGWGMGGPAAAGELLLDPTAMLPAPFPGPAWSGPGSPAPIVLAVPDDLVLIGASVFAQAVLFDGTPGGWGLTTALELVLGC